MIKVTSKELSMKLKNKGVYQGIDQSHTWAIHNKNYFYWIDTPDGVIIIYGEIIGHLEGKDNFIARAFALYELIEECKKIDKDVWKQYSLTKNNAPKCRWVVKTPNELLAKGDTPVEAVGYFLLWLIENSKTNSSEKPNSSKINS